jgi:MFS family permease
MKVLASYSATLRGISKPARLFLLSTVLYWLGMTFVQLYLNFFLQSLGLDQSWIGLINAAPQLTVVALTLTIGTFSARVGSWRAMILGTVLAGGGIAVMAAAPDAWSVLAASVVTGAGGGLVWANSGPFMMANSQEHVRGTLFSWQSAIGTLTGFFAFIVGGALPAMLSGWFNTPSDGQLVMRSILLLAAFFYLLSLGPSYLAGKQPGSVTRPEPVAPGEQQRRKRFRIPVEDKRLYVRLILPGSLIGLGAGMTMPFMNLYIEQKFGSSFEELGQLFAWTSIATAVALMVQPILADKFGKVKSVVLVQGASLPFLIVLGYSTSFPLVVLALFVRGALMNMGNPIFSAYSMERIPPREHATFSSLTTSMWALGWAAGSWFSGTIRDAIGFLPGFNILFALMALLYATSMVLLWVWFVREESARRKLVMAEEQVVRAA